MEGPTLNLSNSPFFQHGVALNRLLYRIFIRRFFQMEEFGKFFSKNTQVFLAPFHPGSLATAIHTKRYSLL
jgi:hypothetical protein